MNPYIISFAFMRDDDWMIRFTEQFDKAWRERRKKGKRLKGYVVD